MRSLNTSVAYLFKSHRDVAGGKHDNIAHIR